jgi:hypothetical protein
MRRLKIINMKTPLQIDSDAILTILILIISKSYFIFDV